jgi:hypothetical protein
VAFATTEHFTLQSARASTIAESNGRATMFRGAVSGGLVALGLVATASRAQTRFLVTLSDGTVTRLAAGETTPAKQAEEQSGEEQTKPETQPEAGTDFEEHT